MGQFDFAVAVGTMSTFRAVPSEGHMERVNRTSGYLAKFKSACLKLQFDVPDYSELPTKDFDWMRQVYRELKEIIIDDIPLALANKVTTTHWIDANLFHCLITGRSLTGIPHMCNQTAIDWFSKKKNTVETATYGSEFNSVCISVDQIVDL